MNEDFRLIEPTHPPAAYLGGKRRLAARLVTRIEAIPHSCYAEPFVGMGGVFLRRRRVPRAEVINDVSVDVATLFRVLQRHYQAFGDMLRWQFSGRREFERLMATDPSTLTDLERAARFLYLQKNAFGGKVAGRSFGVDPGASASFNPARLMPLLNDLHERLSGVVIECLPYERFIPRYDREGTLFYLDPPYVGGEADYGPGVFGPEDYERLAELLAGLKGRFVLSINDVPLARRVFGRFEVQEVDTKYSVHGGRASAARELIVEGP